MAETKGFSFGPRRDPGGTLSEWVDFLQGAVERIGHERVTAPDDDWLPTCWLESYTGETVIVGMDFGLFASAATKHELESALAQTALQIGAVRAALLLTVWGVEEGERVEGMEPKDHPGKREFLNLSVLDLDETVSRFCVITRHEGSAPTLGEWEEADHVEGMFLDPLRLALQLTRDLADRPLELFERMAMRLEEEGKDASEYREMVEVLRKNPDAFESMPLTKWFREQKR